MHLRSKAMLAMLAAAYPAAHASDMGEVSTSGPATALIHDSQGKPVYNSAGECWHSSLAAGTGGSASIAAGCRAPGSQSVAAVPRPSAAPASEQARASGHAAPAGFTAAGGSTTQSAAAGTASGSPAYVTDSRGQIVHGSSGECWRTGTWTPAQATVVGCDGVLARALPVPAPAEPGKASAAPQTPTQPGAVSPSQAPAAVPPAPSQAKPESAAPPSKKAPGTNVVPVPSAPSGAPPALGPETGAAALPPEPESGKVTFDTDTLFDFDKSVLKPEGRRKLDVLMSRLADSSVEVVVAVGHTDSIGTNAYNQRLSERRARAVSNYLIEKGLPKEKIFTEGKGESQPVASNASKQGRAKNRRVEVEVVSIRSKK